MARDQTDDAADSGEMASEQLFLASRTGSPFDPVRLGTIFEAFRRNPSRSEENRAIENPQYEVAAELEEVELMPEHEPPPEEHDDNTQPVAEEVSAEPVVDASAGASGSEVEPSGQEQNSADLPADAPQLIPVATAAPEEVEQMPEHEPPSEGKDDLQPVAEEVSAEPVVDASADALGSEVEAREVEEELLEEPTVDAPLLTPVVTAVPAQDPEPVVLRAVADVPEPFTAPDLELLELNGNSDEDYDIAGEAPGVEDASAKDVTDETNVVGEQLVQVSADEATGDESKKDIGEDFAEDLDEVESSADNGDSDALDNPAVDNPAFEDPEFKDAEPAAVSSLSVVSAFAPHLSVDEQETSNENENENENEAGELYAVASDSDVDPEPATDSEPHADSDLGSDSDEVGLDEQTSEAPGLRLVTDQDSTLSQDEIEPDIAKAAEAIDEIAMETTDNFGTEEAEGQAEIEDQVENTDIVVDSDHLTVRPEDAQPDLPSVEDLRAMAIDLDDVDAILERLDNDEEALFADMAAASATEQSFDLAET